MKLLVTHVSCTIFGKWFYRIENRDKITPPTTIINNINIKWTNNKWTASNGYPNQTSPVLKKRNKRKCLLIEVADSGGQNIGVKENDKLTTYVDFRINSARMWGIQIVIDPVIIVTLGSIPPNFQIYIKKHE